ncbi:MAG: N,N-dimethylformamidase beta subunit family domain-containing protein [Ilumatobacteraceae bacterium]
MTDDITRYDAVEAYCSDLSVVPGASLALHVSCRTGRYDIAIHRWGATLELVWSADGLAGTEHPTPDDADSNGCDWPSDVTVPIGDDWRTGFYLVTLTARDAPADRAVGYAAFIVRGGQRRNRALLVIATNTYNAYNSWGGKSLYTGGWRVSFARPFGRGMLMRPGTERDDRKARPRYRREDPDVDGMIYQDYRFANGYPGFMGSAGWFTYERRFVEWAEGQGLDLDYAVSSDLDRDAGVVDGYDLLVGVGHDEYWSAGQRAVVERHVRGGGNYVSLSGNTMFWQVRLEDDRRAMVCYKYRAHEIDPVMGTDAEGTMSGMWADPVVGRPETALFGAGSAQGMYSRFGMATPRGSGAFTVYRNDHWMFEGTGLRYGDLLGADDGVVGYETVGCRLAFDAYQLPVAAGGDGTPSEIEVVAFTPSSNLAMGEYPASIAALEDQGDLEFIAARLHGRVDEETLALCRHGNAVMVTCRPFGGDGGEVVSIGSTDWVFGLAGDPLVGRVTRNVIEHGLGGAQQLIDVG